MNNNKNIQKNTHVRQSRYLPKHPDIHFKGSLPSILVQQQRHQPPYIRAQCGRRSVRAMANTLPLLRLRRNSMSKGSHGRKYNNCLSFSSLTQTPNCNRIVARFHGPHAVIHQYYSQRCNTAFPLAPAAQRVKILKKIYNSKPSRSTYFSKRKVA